MLHARVLDEPDQRHLDRPQGSQGKLLRRVHQVRRGVSGGGTIQRDGILAGENLEGLRHADGAVHDRHAPALLALLGRGRRPQVGLARPQRPQIEGEPPLDVGEQRALARGLQDGARIRTLQPEPGLLRDQILGVALHAQQRPAAQPVQAQLLEQLAEALEHRRDAARREPGQLIHQVEIAVQPGFVLEPPHGLRQRAQESVERARIGLAHDRQAHADDLRQKRLVAFPHRCVDRAQIADHRPQSGAGVEQQLHTLDPALERVGAQHPACLRQRGRDERLRLGRQRCDQLVEVSGGGCTNATASTQRTQRTQGARTARGCRRQSDA